MTARGGFLRDGRKPEEINRERRSFRHLRPFIRLHYNMFQRNVFGFRYQPQCQQDKQYVQSRVHPEGVGVTQRVEHRPGTLRQRSCPMQLVAVEQVMPKSRLQQLGSGHIPISRAWSGETTMNISMAMAKCFADKCIPICIIYQQPYQAAITGNYSVPGLRIYIPAVSRADTNKGRNWLHQQITTPHLLGHVGITRQFEDFGYTVNT